MDSTRAPSGSETVSANAADPPGGIPWQRLLLFALSFYICAELGRIVSSLSANYVNFWLPAGIYVSALLLNKTRHWPWFVLAALPANVAFDRVHGTSWLLALGFYGRQHARGAHRRVACAAICRGAAGVHDGKGIRRLPAQCRGHQHAARRTRRRHRPRLGGDER